jgi:hypothetical protein
MINGVITASILQEKANKRKVANISKATYDIQIAVYRETLTDLEKYLDVGDLRKLTSRSLGVIRDDILEIINGVRDLRSRIPPGRINSVDGTLDKLRRARNSLQTAIGMFNLSGKLKENKSAEFFDLMDVARKFIEEALELFKPR